MKSFVEEYGRVIVVSIVVIALILIASLFASQGLGSVNGIWRNFALKAGFPNYEMVSATSEINPGEEGTYVSEAAFEKFTEVRVDGNVIVPGNYTAGGTDKTQITLKGTYTDTLDGGKHTIDVVSNDGFAQATFKVIPKPRVLVTGSNFCRTIPSGTTEVIFTDEKTPDGVTTTDVSKDGDGKVVAWLDGTTYKVSTQAPGEKVYANPNSASMFNGQSNAACRNLTSIDCSNLDTSLVTNMSYMFNYAGYNVSTFEIKGLSGWDTSKVTDMASMFRSAGYNASTCSIDLSGWDTSKVTDMQCMFYSAGYDASTWNIGDLSGWDTSKVTDMSFMFYCAGYDASTFNLDLSGWDASSVENMTLMFYSAGHNASSWNIGDLSNWDTSKVTAMTQMFQEAGYNASGWHIDCSSWNVGKVTNHNGFNNFVASKVTAPTWVN